ncbi:short-chain dehydrogenase reductase sdr [Trichoderma cornu-damae]|uniref:Short-chain dehydrogenase reductase sdr n=1 Tax=Trichoderma cornu-damae TaxID=654480 RepID=A0A9P8TWS7_9HYPO|nr:short-chain dehydrogenase reductase sdr [Trichoderma cornu-damae]
MSSRPLIAGVANKPHSQANFAVQNQGREPGTAGPKSSIVICASSAVRSGQISFDDVNYNDGETYDPLAAYGQSNAARVMFVKILEEKLRGENIRVFSIDPGAVATGLQRHFATEFLEQHSSISTAVRRKCHPSQERLKGAATLITAMVDQTIQESNGAFLHQQLRSPTRS